MRPFIPLMMLVATACVQKVTIPKLGTQEITLQIQASSAVLAPGETDTITVTATNTLTEQVRLVFGTSCQILVYIRTRSAHIVVPDGGSYDCLPVPSQLVIPAGGSVSRQFLWKGSTAFDPPGSATRLPMAEYFVVAEMIAGTFRVAAPAVKITLVP